jgi:hypothetical protein
MVVQNCLKTEEGIIVPVYSKPMRVDRKELVCRAIEIGILLSIGEIDIPVPEDMIDHMATHRRVAIYFLDGEKYLLEPAAKFEIPQELLFEARGVYKHFKNNQV